MNLPSSDPGTLKYEPDQAHTASLAGGGSGEHPSGSPSPPTGGLPVIPGYDVMGEIARGGMGRVLAARELALDREVAVKVLLPKGRADRFVTEAYVTARLPHPNIPPVYALGTLADGTPFLAMKYVRGHTLDFELQALTDGADLPRLVQVFEGICQAVGFAHARNIVHRDLKPANVMVGEFGEVQVMDWGLAKFLPAGGKAEPEPASNLEANGQADLTRTGSVLGTPAYMAPEQARGEPVDARADVFALGGLLTAMLTGKPVFAGKTSADVVRQAAAADTSAALARLATCGADPELVAVATDCLAVTLAARPPDGRAVAASVAAYRAGAEGRLRQAEQARAAATATAAVERRRRRVVWVAAGLVVAMLLAGVAATAWQAVRAGRAESAAVAEADNARAAEVNERVARFEADRKEAAATAAKQFLQNVLVQTDARGQAAAGRPSDPFLPLRAALDTAAGQIAGKFADQPELDADLRDTIGRAYLGLGLPAAAEPFLTAAARLRERTLGPDHPATLMSANNIAVLYEAKGDYQSAEVVLRKALAAQEKSLGADHPDTLRTVSNLAAVLSAAGNPVAAGPLFRRALDGRERTLGSNHPDTLRTLEVFATFLQANGDAKAAESLFRRSLSEREKTLGPDHPDTLVSVSNLAATLRGRGDLTAAEAHYRRALAGKVKVFGPDHPTTLATSGNLAVLLYAAGNSKAAEPLFRSVLAGRERMLGPNHPETLGTAADLAAVLHRLGDSPSAEALLKRALAGQDQSLGADHPSTLRTVHLLATLYRANRNLGAAEPLHRRAVEAVKRGEYRNPQSGLYVASLVGCLRDLARLPDAERWQRDWHTVVAGRSGPDSAAAVAEQTELGRLLLAQDKWIEGETTLRQALAAAEARSASPPPAWQVAVTRSLLGTALLGQRRYAEAEPLLLASYDGLTADPKAVPAAGRKSLPLIVERLIALHAGRGEPGEAAKWQAERAKYPPELAPAPRLAR